jgi:hypothetical protein
MRYFFHTKKKKVGSEVESPITLAIKWKDVYSLRLKSALHGIGPILDLVGRDNNDNTISMLMIKHSFSKCSNKKIGKEQM